MGWLALLPSVHHTQQLQRMTNNSGRRSEERREKTHNPKAVQKLETAPWVRNSTQTKTPLSPHWHCRSREITQAGDRRAGDNMVLGPGVVTELTNLYMGFASLNEECWLFIRQRRQTETLICGKKGLMKQ